MKAQRGKEGDFKASDEGILTDFIPDGDGQVESGSVTKES